jgi:hypothetical protein
MLHARGLRGVEQALALPDLALVAEVRAGEAVPEVLQAEDAVDPVDGRVERRPIVEAAADEADARVRDRSRR